jgi:hypothetical protein
MDQYSERAMLTQENMQLLEAQLSAMSGQFRNIYIDEKWSLIQVLIAMTIRAQMLYNANMMTEAMKLSREILLKYDQISDKTHLHNNILFATCAILAASLFDYGKKNECKSVTRILFDICGGREQFHNSLLLLSDPFSYESEAELNIASLLKHKNAVFKMRKIHNSLTARINLGYDDEALPSLMATHVLQPMTKYGYQESFYCFNNLAIYHANLGDFEEARRILDDAAILIGHPWSEIAMAINLLAIGIMTDNDEVAERAIQRGNKCIELGYNSGTVVYRFYANTSIYYIKNRAFLQAKKNA